MKINIVKLIINFRKKFISLPKKQFLNWFSLILVLIISLTAHCYNFLHFPYFENDEGVYFSQAYSVLKEGKLAPYTYWYDHAPLGWILMSLWLLITGGPFTFGFSLNSARIFIALIHLFSSILVFLITRKYSKNWYNAILAVLIFSLSPLSVYFQRRVLLDNIMIFWILLSYYLIIAKNLNLKKIILSAVFFAFAVLTKESAVFFLPAFFYQVYNFSDKKVYRINTGIWIAVFISLTAYYFLYSILKGELFPSGFLGINSYPHVSLLETVKFQLARSGGSWINPLKTSFITNSLLWIKQDFFITIFGLLSIISLAKISFKKNKYNILKPLVILPLSYLFFLIKGGLILEFYIVPLIPFLCISIAILWNIILELINKKNKLLLKYLSIFSFIFVIINFVILGRQSRAFPQSKLNLNLYTSNQTTVQIQAVNWIRQNLPQNSFIAIDNYSYLDLKIPYKNNASFPNIHPSWKIEYDNDIKEKLFKNDPSQINYIALTPQMSTDINSGNLPFLSKTLQNSTFVKAFDHDGWSVNIYTSKYPQDILERSWNYYKNRFIKNNGRVIDPYQNDLTTSEGQSYALLRAVWINDQETFQKVWDWTKSNLYQPETGLLTWRWQSENISDLGTAPDADTDTALALLFASRLWNEPDYEFYALKIIKGIWNHETKTIDKIPYLIAGNWAIAKPILVFNPSYLAPYAYKIFAQIDPNHEWNKLVDSSYKVLENCINSPLDKYYSANLPPNWCTTDYYGNYVFWNEEGINSTDYSYDAMRSMWRLALDYLWFQDSRAKNILNLTSQHLINQWNTENRLVSSYNHSGIELEPYESVLTYSANLNNLKITNPELASIIYKEKIEPKFYENFDSIPKEHYWEDPDNYYTQNWVWLNFALYTDNIKNLWE